MDFQCKQRCSSADMQFTVESCDVATVRRDISWSWAKRGDCDEERGLSLPDDTLRARVTGCDYLPFGATGALVIVAGLLVALKLGMLALVAAYRSLAVMRNAEPSLCDLSIVGGIAMDLTTLAMLGEVTTRRCHALASSLLLATTLLYGPLGERRGHPPHHPHTRRTTPTPAAPPPPPPHPPHPHFAPLGPRPGRDPSPTNGLAHPPLLLSGARAVAAAPPSPQGVPPVPSSRTRPSSR